MTEIEKLKDAIQNSETILIGAGAGLSTAAGYTYSGERFRSIFSDFEEKYGFHDMYSGGFYPFPTREEFWAYWSRYIFCNRYDQLASEVHRNLFELVKSKNYFVITTNLDHLFQSNGFDKSRLFYTQGDYGLFQCSTPCHQKTYDNEDQIRRMVSEQRDMKIPTELIPKCPRCGEEMTLNLRSDDLFVEDDGWHEAAERYREFLQRNLGKSMLLLELGVGSNTPGIIKYPFWEFTREFDETTLATINFGEAFVPKDIRKKSIVINENIAEVLEQLRGES
ncbi:MAG: Sir2 silent information regulator family NAD-dependent deacetylase [Selenomonadaceae bacterium]|nr:Sir2 silent information regulator family NAD-dependent deacetylase [Selenomonadaceae bacterium]